MKNLNINISTSGIRELEKIGFAKSENVIDSTVIKIKKAYPCYFGKGYNNLYKAQGMDDRGAYKRIYRMLVRTYEELGKEKEAEEYREVLRQL
jgi:ribonuclease HII